MENTQQQGVSGAFQGPLRYCLYARKSSEQDERQALSIESQIKEMVEMAMRDGLTVSEIKQESHSAKDSGERPIFNELIKDIKEGKFDGIITWDPSRISRNAGDLGRVVDLMDAGVLKEIRTHGQRFTNSPNEKFLLMILCSQAKLENDHKGENVKRGLRTKCEMGWRPGAAPLGYIHDKTAKKGQKLILVDPIRAPIIKEMFEMIAHRGKTGGDVFRWLLATNFTTRTGKKITKSMVYNILRHTFYYGEFEYPVGTGKVYKGGYDPIIDRGLFDKVQSGLVYIPKLRPGTKEFNFVKMFKCGACGSGMTASEKYKKLKDGSINKYIYYHCTRFKDMHCKEPYIREDHLIEQLLELIDKVSINKLGAKDKLEREIARQKYFSKEILGNELVDTPKIDQVNIKNYAKYILREGTREEKRELLSYLKDEIFIKGGEIELI